MKQKKVDLIFDIKGFLWYELVSFKGRRKAEAAMMMYWDLLKPSGIVIVEGYERKRQKLFINYNQMTLSLFKKITWYAEASTYHYLRKVYSNSPQLKSHFREVIISDGIYTLVYYQKIDAAIAAAA